MSRMVSGELPARMEAALADMPRRASARSISRKISSTEQGINPSPAGRKPVERAAFASEFPK